MAFDPQPLFADEPQTRVRKLTPQQADEAQRKRRGREKRNLRNASFGSPNRKLLMMILDDHIGDAKAWDLTFATLARETDLHRSTVYRVAGELAELGLISFAKVDGSERLWRFRIHHSNVPDFVDGDARQGHRRRRRTVASCESTPLIGATISPPPPDARKAAAALNALGVDRAVAAVEQATANGVSPAEVLAIASHAADRPGAWGAGAVYDRVRNAIPGQPPEAGWPAAASPQARPRVPPPEFVPEDPKLAHERWLARRRARGQRVDLAK